MLKLGFNNKEVIFSLVETITNVFRFFFFPVLPLPVVTALVYYFLFFFMSCGFVLEPIPPHFGSVGALKLHWSCSAEMEFSTLNWFEVALKLLLNCSKMVLAMISNCPQTALKLPWSRSGMFQAGFQNYFVLQNCSWIALKLLWNCSEIALKLLWNPNERLKLNCSRMKSMKRADERTIQRIYCNDG